MTTPTETEPRPLSEIIKRLHEDADEYSPKSWKKGNHYTSSALPPDIRAVLDQIKDVSDLAPSVDSSMRHLLKVARTMGTSENTEKSIIGGVLLQCFEEISTLTKFCKDLEDRTVDYPIQDKKDDQ